MDNLNMAERCADMMPLLMNMINEYQNNKSSNNSVHPAFRPHADTTSGTSTNAPAAAFHSYLATQKVSPPKLFTAATSSIDTSISTSITTQPMPAATNELETTTSAFSANVLSTTEMDYDKLTSQQANDATSYSEKTANVFSTTIFSTTESGEETHTFQQTTTASGDSDKTANIFSTSIFSTTESGGDTHTFQQTTASNEDSDETWRIISLSLAIVVVVLIIIIVALSCAVARLRQNVSFKYYGDNPTLESKGTRSTSNSSSISNDDNSSERSDFESIDMWRNDTQEVDTKTSKGKKDKKKPLDVSKYDMYMKELETSQAVANFNPDLSNIDTETKFVIKRPSFR